MQGVNMHQHHSNARSTWGQPADELRGRRVCCCVQNQAHALPQGLHQAAALRAMADTRQLW